MRIGEVAQLSGISARMLRHYDRIGLLSPGQRTSNGYRSYERADLDRLFQIEGLRSLGLGLREIGEVLGQDAWSPEVLVDQLIGRTRQRIARDQRLLARLERIDTAAPESWGDVLGLVGLLHDLDSADPMTRVRALLGGAAEPLPAPALVAALVAERDPGVAATLQWALAAAPDPLPAIDESLTSPDARVRRNLTGALARISGPGANSRLVELLSDPDPEVEHRAALALGVRGVPDALPALVATIAAGHNDVLAAEGLAAIGAHSPAQLAVVVEAVVTELAARAGQPIVRLRLVEALAELPVAATDSVWQALADDPDTMVARTADYLRRRSAHP